VSNVQPNNSQLTFMQSNKLSTSNNVSASSISAKDIADIRINYMQKQQSLS